jgi:hypothetical protein
VAEPIDVARNPESSDFSAQLDAALKSETLDREDLRNIYAVKSQIFLSDNNRIWTTGAIIVPLAFGVVAALEANKDATSLQRFMAGLAGWMLLALWNLFADRHRAWQDDSKSWLRSIEKVYGCERPGSAHGSNHRWWHSVRTYRWLVAVLFALYPLWYLWAMLFG